MGEADRAMSGKLRGRGLGLPFPGATGTHNAVTDVAGVEVGTVTLISGDGPLRRGHGPVRTGVTAILPRGRASARPCAAGYFSLNGNGELTGTAWIEESGELQSPITITNTHSCGRDLRRRAERHQRLPRHRRARGGGPGRRAGRSRGAR
jgi:L-aminopeptidase/D-esterase-like protein